MSEVLTQSLTHLLDRAGRTREVKVAFSSYQENGRWSFSCRILLDGLEPKGPDALLVERWLRGQRLGAKGDPQPIVWLKGEDLN
uniref:Uncharacterized protein n=1 Tax=uncultured organism Bio4 TaxID=460931 RepID=B2BKA3_9ZZZZ|nr:unknown [uncultured organism Bio4]